MARGPGAGRGGASAGHAGLTRRVRVLVVNAGSSSLKLRVVGEGRDPVVAADLPAVPAHELPGALAAFLEEAGAVDAAGHRVVHGGPRLRAPTELDDGVLAALDSVAELAPLHAAPALAAMRALRAARPALPAVACFDSAFHATLPPEAAEYALPAAWRARWGLRRLGFHGLSHAWAASRAAELLGRPVAELRLVTAHLGAGASLAAVAGGRSVDTTMGFTPLEGVVMATRSGSVDPGLLLWLLRHGGVSADELERALERDAGLRGLAGGSGDMRDVLERAERQEDPACLALGVYLHRLAGAVAAMVAALGGLDALVFTGGVGEGAPAIRARAVARLGFLGLRVDPERNAVAGGDAVVSPGGEPAVVVVTAREDLEIARQVRETLRA